MLGFGREDDDDDPLLPDSSDVYPNAGEQSPSGSAGEVDWGLLNGGGVAHAVARMFRWMRLGDVRNHVVKRPAVFPVLTFSPSD